MSFEEIFRDTIPEVVRGLKHLLEEKKTQGPQTSSSSIGKLREASAETKGPKRPMDLNKVECWNCNEKGHYSSSCPKGNGSSSITAHAVLPTRIMNKKDRTDDDSQGGSSSDTPMMCVMTVEPDPAIAASQPITRNQKGKQSQRSTVRDAGVGQRTRETGAAGQVDRSQGLQRLSED